MSIPVSALFIPDSHGGYLKLGEKCFYTQENIAALQAKLETSQGWNTANIREAAIARDRYRAAEAKLEAAEQHVRIMNMQRDEYSKERAALQAKLEAVGELVAAVEEYLIAPATTGPQRLREALGKYITTRTP